MLGEQATEKKKKQIWKTEQAEIKVDLKSPKVWKITDYVGH